MRSKLPDNEVLYKALVEKNSEFEGIFFAAIKTTGIFCRPTCTARKPKKENVEYFSTANEALQHGYRPCRICSPMGYKGDYPDWLKKLMEDVAAEPSGEYRDFSLRERGIDPNRLRRWFKKHHGMTFQSYLRSLRISGAFGRIRHGNTVIESAFDSGYGSLSGFAGSFKKNSGFSPVMSSERELLVLTRILTPLGPMIACASERGICLLEFSDRRMLETNLKRLTKRLNAEIIPGKHGFFDQLDAELNEYFRGERKNFSVPLDPHGTDFQMKIWDILRTIPYGETRSYKDQAEAAGNVKAVRAVASANGDNMISILIPCHRVIGSDGRLVGYGGGLWRKDYLLKLEKDNL